MLGFCPARHAIIAPLFQLQPSMPKPVPARYQHLRSFAFGDGPALADELLDLVMKGVKTATCSTEDEPNTSSPGEQ